MCNMAAYAGREQAAPILLRMLGNEEAYGGGHFTGLATIDDDGKLHFAKACGPLSHLLETTDAAKLPGRVGIAHSRTPGFFADDEWAHPFLARDARLAYCGNGMMGVFEKTTDLRGLYAKLTALGVHLRTEKPLPPGETYPYVTPEGNVAHISDLMAALIAEHHYRDGIDVQEAFNVSYNEAPAEATGLCVCEDEPDRVSACRLNQPLMWGRNATGNYLATAALAYIDEPLDGIHPVAAGTTLAITATGFSSRPLTGRLAKMISPVIPYAAATEILDALMADGKTYHIGTMAEAIKTLWQPPYLQEAAMLAYQYAHEKVMAGKLEVVRNWTKATLPGARTPEWRFRLRQESPGEER